MFKYLVIALAFFLIYSVSQARPQYSMTTGNKCISCHVNPNGGGARDQLGWYTRKDVSLVKPKWIGLKELYDLASTNLHSIGEQQFTFGADYRLQTARLGPSFNSERDFFSMQLSPYLVYDPLNWLSFRGHYNLVETVYEGQESWSASATIKPSFKLPQLKVGYIQPSIGMRYDDHTVLVRQFLSANKFGAFKPLIPIDYAEWGAELNYEGLRWLSAAAGVYRSENMSEIKTMSNRVDQSTRQRIQIGNTGPENVSTLLRVAFLPRFFDNKINTNIGGSFFNSGDFQMINIFVHVGLTDHLSLMTEYANAEKESSRESDNYLVELTYQLLESLMLHARFEAGETRYKFDFSDQEPFRRKYMSNQYAIGGQIYLLPFIELRPEYRIYDHEHLESYQSQWTVQLHVYY